MDQALIIYDHLEGEAREKTKYRSPEERKDPNKVLSILKELYGCTNHMSLQEDFFSRKQQHGETLQEFSNALMFDGEGCTKIPSWCTYRAVLLRDQFVEHVFVTFTESLGSLSGATLPPP